MVPWRLVGILVVAAIVAFIFFGPIAVIIPAVAGVIAFLWVMYGTKESEREIHERGEERLERQILKTTKEKEAVEREEEKESRDLMTELRRLKSSFTNPYIGANIDNMIALIKRFKKEDIRHEEADFENLINYWHEALKTIKQSMRGRELGKKSRDIIEGIDEELKRLRELLREEKGWELKKRILTRKLVLAERED